MSATNITGFNRRIQKLIMKKSNRKIFAILAAAFVVILSAYIFLQYPIFNNPTIKSFCAKDTDCVSVCGSCVNVTYFHSNPPEQCAVSLNNTGRSCFCVNNICSVQTNVTSEQQPIIQTKSSDIFTFYILIAVIVVTVFLAIGFFVNHLMNSPTETW
jgi:hypothetical protein